jgi:hypothetical protein
MNYQYLFCMGQMLILSLGLLSYSFSPQPTLVETKSGQLAHYIVFKKFNDGSNAPAYYSQVALTAPLRSVSDSQMDDYLAQPSRNVERLVVMLQAKNEIIVYQNVVEVPPGCVASFTVHKQATRLMGISCQTRIVPSLCEFPGLREQCC